PRWWAGSTCCPTSRPARRSDSRSRSSAWPRRAWPPSRWWGHGWCSGRPTGPTWRRCCAVRGRRRAMLLLVLVVLAACTHGTTAPGNTPSALPLTGTLLVGPGQTFGGLGLYDLSQRRLTRIEGVPPQRAEFFFGARPVAVP